MLEKRNVRNTEKMVRGVPLLADTTHFLNSLWLSFISLTDQYFSQSGLPSQEI